MEHFFPSNSSGDLRSDAHESQIIWGEADVDHTQIIDGGYSQNIWRIYSPIPPGFGTPAQGQGSRIQEQVFSKNKTKKSSSKIFFRRSPKKQKKSPSKFSARFLSFSNKVLTFQRV